MNIPNLDTSSQKNQNPVYIPGSYGEDIQIPGHIVLVPGDKSCSIGAAKAYTDAYFDNNIEEQEKIQKLENQRRYNTKSELYGCLDYNK